MSQDTRKDKRAKVVSLNVRYKSPTVDQFIDNHSHDVSRGGVFVKTPSPFAPGTLLKFEIRLAGNESVISGVGRVVWTRDAAQASSQAPAGMGVKFIKLEDSSRALIERLVTEKSDAGRAYEAGLPATPASVPPRSVPAITGASHPSPVPPAPITTPGVAPPSEAPRSTPSRAPNRLATTLGVAPAPATSKAPPAPPAPPAPASSKAPLAPLAPPSIRPPAALNRKATIMGVGIPLPDDSDSDATLIARPGEGPGEPPREERSIAIEASALLAEALLEAGSPASSTGQHPILSSGSLRGSELHDDVSSGSLPSMPRADSVPSLPDLPQASLNESARLSRPAVRTPVGASLEESSPRRRLGWALAIGLVLVALLGGGALLFRVSSFGKSTAGREPPGTIQSLHISIGESCSIALNVTTAAMFPEWAE
jgi:uncharacterized protein (TIGR02266 family)